MNPFLNLVIAILTIVSATNGGVLNNGKTFQSQIDSLLAQLQSIPMDAILYWDLVTLQACANDYDTSVTAVPENEGPPATTRAFAIIHGAMYDSMAAFSEKLQPLFQPPNMPYIKKSRKSSAVNAAIMQAAYQTLGALYPTQQPIFDAVKKQYLKQLTDSGSKQADIDEGILIGTIVSAFILASRKNDGSQNNKPYTPINHPGYHRVDPTHPTQGFLSPNWGQVKPFLLDYGSQFRPSNVVGDTPASRLNYLNSTQFVNDFYEDKLFGVSSSIYRTADETEIGKFWSYDGAPKIGVPPRLYNQVVRVIAIQQKNTLEDNAYLFALINYAMADAAIAAWDCKFYYSLWRPIVGVRLAPATYTEADPYWIPLGAQADAIGSTDFTPPFPSYVSGHSTFGSTIFEVLRLFYGTDNIRFKLESDEYNGKTIDSLTGQPRPVAIRYYQSFTQAELENYLSRIYLGVHWRTDQANGRILGQTIGQFAFNKF